MKHQEVVEQAKNFAQELVKAGLKVYVKEDNFTWGYFTDGRGIGYFQAGSLVEGVGLSTVHIPNSSTGTGFRYCDDLCVKSALNIISGYLPNFVNNRMPFKPWGSWEHFAMNQKFWQFFEFDGILLDNQ